MFSLLGQEGKGGIVFNSISDSCILIVLPVFLLTQGETFIEDEKDIYAITDHSKSFGMSPNHFFFWWSS